MGGIFGGGNAPSAPPLPKPKPEKAQLTPRRTGYGSRAMIVAGELEEDPKFLKKKTILGA